MRLGDGAGQPGQADGIGGADEQDLVGCLERLDREPVALGTYADVGGRVLLEAEAGVDHDLGLAPGALHDRGQGARTHLDPTVRAGQAGDDQQVVGEPALHGREPFVDRPARDQPGGREQSRDLVEDAELLGDRAAVGVGVEEHGREPAAGQLGGEGRGQGGPTGRAARIPRPRSPGRPVEPVLSRTATGASVGAADSAGPGSRITASASSSTRSAATTASMPIRWARARATSSSGATATARTPYCRSWSTTGPSRPLSSAPSTATWA